MYSPGYQRIRTKKSTSYCLIFGKIARGDSPGGYPDPDGKYMYGTGWMIAPGLLITNYHVIDARDRRPSPWGAGELRSKQSDFELQAINSLARFDFKAENVNTKITESKITKVIAVNPKLDYAILALGDSPNINDRVPLPLAQQPQTLVKGERINIVQHPRGGPLHYAIRNNFFVRMSEKPGFLLYQTDTETGSSGSPVLNDDWKVIGLHRAAIQIPAEYVPQEVVDGNPLQVKMLNEAISINSILEDLRTKHVKI